MSSAPILGWFVPARARRWHRFRYATTGLARSECGKYELRGEETIHATHFAPDPLMNKCSGCLHQ